jgi:uncharacterized protein YndB with AHSA1/START domain
MFNKYQLRGIAVMLSFMALTGCQTKSANSGSTDTAKTDAVMKTTVRDFTNATDDQVPRDIARRSQDIHWPKGFSPEMADLYAHNEIVIDAPASTVFRHIQEAERWPKWYSNSQNVRLLNSPDGLLKAGTEWEWDTFGVHIHSRINEFVKAERIGWFGDGTGMNAYHTWYLVSLSANKTRVIMEECVNGEGAKTLRKKDPAAMHRGHDLWNNTLKKLSEGK